jgi:hypothetical protein
MFVVTSLPMTSHTGTDVFKFTFFDKYVMCESSDGQKNVQPFFQAPLRMVLEKSATTVELILVPGVTSAWYRFPTGTYDKILEHVYNFKGGDLLDLLN